MSFRRCLLALSAVLATPSVYASALVNTDGFETPDYSAGALGDQEGWINLGSGDSTAVIQDEVFLTGTQALRVERASGSNRFWLQPIDSLPSGRLVTIDWAMSFEQSEANGGVGPFLGVQAFDDSSGSVLQAVGFGLDTSTGELLFQAAGTGNLVASRTRAFPGEWNRFRIEIDFGAKTYSSFFNDEMIASDIGLIDGVSIDRLTDVDVVALLAGGDAASQSNGGVAYLDDFLVRDGLRGDYNNDGFVDIADYTVWRDNLQQTGLGVVGDGDANGVVDENDYRIWIDNFGLSNALAPAGAAATPEPSSLGLGLITLGCLSCRRRE